MKLLRAAFLWFMAGCGLDLQGRVIDHWLDPLVQSVAWLAWLR